MLLSCEGNQTNSGDSKKLLQRKPASHLNNAEVPEGLLTLKNENPGEVNRDTLMGNLFGRFFCDRAEFFVIDDPTNEIYSKRPSTIVLYFLDGALCQSKYELEENISDRLFTELGKCRIRGLDARNKMIIAANEIRINSNGSTMFNPKLDNYELRWTMGDKEIRFRVERIKDRKTFTYTERLKSYEKEMDRIETYC
jgi:hypothetical protein